MTVSGVPRLANRGGVEVMALLARVERADERRRRRLLSVTVAALLLHALLALVLPWSSDGVLPAAPTIGAARD